MVGYMSYMAMYSLVDQEERTQSVQQFRAKQKDVLVATDVASKGLDFPDIQHVINYDMPEDIENYGGLILLYVVLVSSSSNLKKVLAFQQILLL